MAAADSKLEKEELRSEQEIVRREKLKKVREKSYAYPNDVHVTSTAAGLIESITTVEQTPPEARARVQLAGRIMAMRLMGKAAFCHLQDRTGRVQFYIRKEDVGEEIFAEFKTFDIGDIVFVSGYGFTTKTGEPSLHAESIRLLVKCLHPLPEKWAGLTDKEIRYRQRYLDLIINSEVKSVFVARARIIKFIRDFFDARDYIEVETPTLNTIASGAAARPFITHHNALDLELHQRIALELPLKRLVVGGIERVYELGRVFRNEGISTQHNPEFTMLEFYEAYADFHALMDLTEELIQGLCVAVCGSPIIEFREMRVDFSGPWKRLKMTEALYEVGGLPRTIDLDSLGGVHAAAAHFGFEDIQGMHDYGRALYEIFDRTVEDKIVNPTFITHYPLAVSPLSRPSAEDARFVDRFELIVAGMELANGFSELNDPEDQLERFLAQSTARSAGDEETMEMDEDFVTALEYGMPPTAGEGIGIDRLTMLLTNSSSIRDVILFPLMRPVEMPADSDESTQ